MQPTRSADVPIRTELETTEIDLIFVCSSSLFAQPKFGLKNDFAFRSANVFF